MEEEGGGMDAGVNRSTQDSGIGSADVKRKGADMVTVRRDRLKAIKLYEWKEQPSWNTSIVPTWDDGPDRNDDGELADNTVKIIRVLREYGVTQFRFYWTGANLLSARIRKKFGIEYKNGLPQSTQIGPGYWAKWVLLNKPPNIPRNEFINSLIDPAVKKEYSKIAASLPPGVRMDDIIGYHGMLHNWVDNQGHIMNVSQEAVVDDMLFFQELMRAASGNQDYTLKHGRPPYGGGFAIPGTNNAPTHTAKMLEAGRVFSQIQRKQFQWELWRIETKDWKLHTFDVNRILNKTPKLIKANKSLEWDIGPAYILMHSRFYEEPANLEKLRILFKGFSRNTSR